MSPIRGHLLLLTLTALVCTGGFVLDFLYLRQGGKGESVAKKLDADWWHNGRASLGIKGQSIWGIACAGYCYLLIAFDVLFPTAALLHVWFELLMLLLYSGSGIAFGVLVGLSDLAHLFQAFHHDRTFCILGIVGIILCYLGSLLALVAAVFVWRVPRRIVQSSDGKRFWRRSIRQIYHNRYTGLPNVIFADLDSPLAQPQPKKRDSGGVKGGGLGGGLGGGGGGAGGAGGGGGESWYQESAYALNTHQRTSWVPPDRAIHTPPPLGTYASPFDQK